VGIDNGEWGMKRIVISNNPMVCEKIKECVCLDTSYLGVLEKVRDLVHLGHELLTHPLSGSVKPGETPYKTVILSGERGELDEASLRIIEESIVTCKKFLGKREEGRDKKVLEDFQLIDYDLVFGKNTDNR